MVFVAAVTNPNERSTFWFAHYLIIGDIVKARIQQDNPLFRLV